MPSTVSSRPPIAFVLLGVVALLCLAAALLHGPALAGLGIVGAYLAPMLVASTEPDYWALYIYIAIVNAAAFALARYRLWRWLAVTALVLGAVWALPGIGAGSITVTALSAHVFHAVTGFVLVATLLVCGLFYGPPTVPDGSIQSRALRCASICWSRRSSCWQADTTQPRSASS